MRPILPRMLPRPVLPLAALVIALLLAPAVGCRGDVALERDGEPDTVTPASGSGGEGEGSQGSGAGSNGGTVDPPATEGFEPAPGGMQRLTRREYGNSIHGIFGEGVEVPEDLEPDPTSTEGFAFQAELARDVTTSTVGVDKYAAAAAQIARQIFGDPDGRVARVGCATPGADGACVDAFLRGFLRSAWRRPATGEEIAAYRAVVDAGVAEFGEEDGGWTGLEFAVAAALESPNFLYRAETGVPVPSGEEDGTGELRRFDDFEMASRLSFLILGAGPDEALLDAAERGELSDDAGLEAQARRLLDDPRAREGVLAFFAEWLGLDALTRLDKDAELFPAATQALGEAMRRDVLHAFEARVFERDEDVRGVFTNREVLVDAALAEVYGVEIPADDGSHVVEIPAEWDRGGLLTTPGLMALNATRTRTSPTLRGLFVLERFLCGHVSPAPNDLDTSALAAPTGGETVRAWSERIRENAQCAVCHNQMDPLGLPFENFDALGRHRTREMDQPIDASGTFLGQPVAGPREVGALLAESDQVATCLVRQMYRYATGHAPTTGEVPVMRGLREDFAAADHRVRELIVALVLSDGFRYLRAPE